MSSSSSSNNNNDEEEHDDENHETEEDNISSINNSNQCNQSWKEDESCLLESCYTFDAPSLVHPATDNSVPKYTFQTAHHRADNYVCHGGGFVSCIAWNPCDSNNNKDNKKGRGSGGVAASMLAIATCHPNDNSSVVHVLVWDSGHSEDKMILNDFLEHALASLDISSSATIVAKQQQYQRQQQQKRRNHNDLPHHHHRRQNNNNLSSKKSNHKSRKWRPSLRRQTLKSKSNAETDGFIIPFIWHIVSEWKNVFGMFLLELGIILPTTPSNDYHDNLTTISTDTSIDASSPDCNQFIFVKEEPMHIFQLNLQPQSSHLEVVHMEWIGDGTSLVLIQSKNNHRPHATPAAVASTNNASSSHVHTKRKNNNKKKKFHKPPPIMLPSNVSVTTVESPYNKIPKGVNQNNNGITNKQTNGNNNSINKTVSFWNVPDWLLFQDVAKGNDPKEDGTKIENSVCVQEEETVAVKKYPRHERLETLCKLQLQREARREGRAAFFHHLDGKSFFPLLDWLSPSDTTDKNNNNSQLPLTKHQIYQQHLQNREYHYGEKVIQPKNEEDDNIKVETQSTFLLDIRNPHHFTTLKNNCSGSDSNGNVRLRINKKKHSSFRNNNNYSTTTSMKGSPIVLNGDLTCLFWESHVPKLHVIPRHHHTPSSSVVNDSDDNKMNQPSTTSYTTTTKWMVIGTSRGQVIVQNTSDCFKDNTNKKNSNDCISVIVPYPHNKRRILAGTWVDDLMAFSSVSSGMIALISTYRKPSKHFKSTNTIDSSDELLPGDKSFQTLGNILLPGGRDAVEIQISWFGSNNYSNDHSQEDQQHETEPKKPIRRMEASSNILAVNCERKSLIFYLFPRMMYYDVTKDSTITGMDAREISFVPMSLKIVAHFCIPNSCLVWVVFSNGVVALVDWIRGMIVSEAHVETNTDVSDCEVIDVTYHVTTCTIAILTNKGTITVFQMDWVPFSSNKNAEPTSIQNKISGLEIHIKSHRRPKKKLQLRPLLLDPLLDSDANTRGTIHFLGRICLSRGLSYCEWSAMTNTRDRRLRSTSGSHWISFSADGDRLSVVSPIGSNESVSIYVVPNTKSQKMKNEEQEHHDKIVSDEMERISKLTLATHSHPMVNIILLFFLGLVFYSYWMFEDLRSEPKFLFSNCAKD